MLSFVKCLFGSKRRRVANKVTFRPTLESLEARNLPAINFVQNSTTTIVVHGDDNGVTRDDAFELRTRFDNGQFQVLQYIGANVIAKDVPASVKEIIFYGDGGVDTLQVKALPATVRITAVDFEAFNVGNNHKFAGILGNMTLTTFIGNATKTAVSFTGDLDSQDHNVTLTRDSLTGLTQGTLDFSRVRLGSLTVASGTGKDRFDVTTPTTGDTFLNTGGGADDVLVQSDLMALGGKLTLNGGDGDADHVGISDLDGALLNPTYSISAASFMRSGLLTFATGGAAYVSTTVNYSGFENATFITGGASPSNVFIPSTMGDTLVRTHNAALVVVGNDAHRLDDIRVGLSVYAASARGDITYGGGQMFLLDQESTTAHNYDIYHPSPGGAAIVRDGVPLVALGMGFETLLAGKVADTFKLVDVDNSAVTPVIVNDGGGSDTLIGLDTASTFTISGPNAGSVGPALSFSNVENLRGGAAADNFVFQTNAQGVAGSLGGQIDGGGGVNKLDYSALTGGVTVDLTAHTASDALSGVVNIRNVTGSKGDDLLRGDDSDNDLRGVDGNDILIGLGGADQLFARVDGIGAGAGRRNLLIGGRGVDTLEGSEGQDILIGGFFTNDLDDFSDAVLREFLRVWNGTGDYATRTHALNHDGVFANGGMNYNLNDDNIQRDDGATDTLHGAGGLDWFWVSSDTTDLTGQEEKTNDNV